MAVLNSDIPSRTTSGVRSHCDSQHFVADVAECKLFCQKTTYKNRYKTQNGLQNLQLVSKVTGKAQRVENNEVVVDVQAAERR